MALKKLCRYTGCCNYRNPDAEYPNFCNKHQDWARQRAQKNDKPDYTKFSESSDLYHCSRWRKERAGFLKQNTYCKCGAKATVIDHIIAHRGNEELFWDHGNWEPMCAECHKKKTWKEMRERKNN